MNSAKTIRTDPRTAAWYAEKGIAADGRELRRKLAHGQPFISRVPQRHASQILAQNERFGIHSRPVQQHLVAGGESSGGCSFFSKSCVPALSPFSIVEC